MAEAASSADRDICRARLAGLVTRSRQRAEDLETLLAAECAALEAQDPENLESIANRKLGCVNDLDAIEADRRALARASGFDDDGSGMLELLGWCCDDETLADEWRALMSIAARCEQQNRRNGAISRVRQMQVRAALAILSGNLDAAPTYGPQGTGIPETGRREIAQV